MTENAPFAEAWEDTKSAVWHGWVRHPTTDEVAGLMEDVLSKVRRPGELEQVLFMLGREEFDPHRTAVLAKCGGSIDALKAKLGLT